MIILYCIREGGKFRIKFHSFINVNNERFTNVYNNEYNCMFPKNIRQIGAFYRVPDADIRLANRINGKPYYSIKRSRIEIMTEAEKQIYLHPVSEGANHENIRIFDAGDCVICLGLTSSVVYVPCGHKCVCVACSVALKQVNFTCPVCRENITDEIIM